MMKDNNREYSIEDNFKDIDKEDIFYKENYNQLKEKYFKLYKEIMKENKKNT